jgi:spermidine synthase
VLALFLLGLSGGAAIASPLTARARDPLGALAAVFAACAATVLLALLAIDDLPDFYAALVARAGADLDAGTGHAVRAAVASVVLPTALLLGAVMPLAIRAYAASLRAIGSDVGRAYAANTLGAIVGSFAGGFVLLPWLGLEPGLRACGAGFVVASGALALRGRSPRLRVGAGIAAVALAAGLFIAPSWRATLGFGGFRYVAMPEAERSRLYEGERLYHRDGVSSTVTVLRDRELVLLNNGKGDASSVTDRPTQILLGLLPIVLHEGSDLRVLVIGYGSGMTVGAAAQSSDVARIDTVELEPAVYEAADRFFSAVNHRPERDPRVRRFVGDGRNFLAALPHRYDVIVSEPPNPWVSGVASLFSREFYALALERLRPGGIFCQWVQEYDTRPATLKIAYRTFLERFPHATAFQTSFADTVLIGRAAPAPLDLSSIEARFADEQVASELRRAGVRSSWDLLARVQLAPAEAARFVGEGPINTDDRAELERAAQRDFLAALDPDVKRGMFEEVLRGFSQYGRIELEIGSGREAGERAAAFAHALVRAGRLERAEEWIERARADAPDAAASAGAELLRARQSAPR